MFGVQELLDDATPDPRNPRSLLPPIEIPCAHVILN